ncbi:phenylacetic acid degradation bifunctional protein PaaZ [Salsipaludibacter albus]|uniref:phenylacetic acid degradation bifunctional protein PaaZ n=1 Tax=Salsipaludibacter albus TaxID=2849650 RepID=UPI001EE4657C|nr:phenylacetic acid degradation bifunctional protein PaaZ [Salsipaludibacter albus]MBY5160988.1 phenylacetic acid degradation bifunctional protein PaaZ [Salsipaludibacter albus]
MSATPSATTVDVLPSHVCDQWRAGRADAGTPVLHDAVTGVPVARVSADGIDLAAAVDHAREVGGPALRAMTFTDRAAVLRRLFKAVIAAKGELYDLSARAGATPDDAWFDVDGGIGAMASYASRGGRKLPDTTVWVDHDLVRVSRDDTFHAVQALVPLPGVAVHVNAFNFPVWGLLEKLAPTLLAGVPAIVKPAPQAAFVAVRAFRALVEAEALPPGTIQLVTGGAVDLLAHLDHRDVVAFTGSSATARRLASHPAVLERNVRFNAETDSINAVVLGPEVMPDSALFDDFLDEVVAECRAKAGQRCTAIRRVLVPSDRLDVVTERLADRFTALVVGDPRRDDVDLGPLVDRTQGEAVRAAITRLSDAATVVTGPDPAELRGVDGDPGTFVAPTLLRADDPRAPVLHDVEAFGPVATLLGYDGPVDAADLVARGGGGLVASVFAPPTSDTADLVRAIAPHHGRVLVVDETSMAAQTGHGSPLPRLHHGGPGRAGGGSELGGLEGLHHYLQRVSIQGSPDLLTAVTGRWASGAARHEGTHPFRKHFDELEVGDSVVAGPRHVTREDIDAFADLTGDHFYAHTDEDAAARNPLFGGIVAHGYFLLSAAAGLFVAPEEGPVLANTGLDGLRFMKPIRPGDEITVTLTCMAKALRPGEAHGEVRWAAEITDGEGELAAVYQLLTVVAA